MEIIANRNKLYGYFYIVQQIIHEAYQMPLASRTPGTFSPLVLLMDLILWRLFIRNNISYGPLERPYCYGVN